VHRLASYEGTIGVRALSEALPELGSEPEGESSVDAHAAATNPRPRTSSAPPRPGPSQGPSRAEFIAAYEACGKSVRAAARHFGKDRRQIYRWLERFGLPQNDDEQD